MQEPCRGVWGYPPPQNFQIGRLRNVIFSTCHEICLRKIDLEYENGKQLQVTIIKIVFTLFFSTVEDETGYFGGFLTVDGRLQKSTTTMTASLTCSISFCCSSFRGFV